MNTRFRKYTLRFSTLIVLCCACLQMLFAADSYLSVHYRDTLPHPRVSSSFQSKVDRELPDLRHRMLTSPQPVEIKQQGRNLCVTSLHNQLLPVYSANGILYSSFRLNKGTNWLSGLPRGSYIINNHKYTIN